jgi:hypothetical protein
MRTHIAEKQLGLRPKKHAQVALFQRLSESAIRADVVAADAHSQTHFKRAVLNPFRNGTIRG